MTKGEFWKNRISETWLYPNESMPEFGPRSGTRQVVTWNDRSGNMALISFRIGDLLDHAKSEKIFSKIAKQGGNLPSDDNGKILLCSYWLALASIAQVDRSTPDYMLSETDRTLEALLRQVYWAVNKETVVEAIKKKKKLEKKIGGERGPVMALLLRP